jgi:hypothetical protein
MDKQTDDSTNIPQFIVSAPTSLVCSFHKYSCVMQNRTEVINEMWLHRRDVENHESSMNHVSQKAVCLWVSLLAIGVAVLGKQGKKWLCSDDQTFTRL